MNLRKYAIMKPPIKIIKIVSIIVVLIKKSLNISSFNCNFQMKIMRSLNFIDFSHMVEAS